MIVSTRWLVLVKWQLSFVVGNMNKLPFPFGFSDLYLFFFKLLSLFFLEKPSYSRPQYLLDRTSCPHLKSPVLIYLFIYFSFISYITCIITFCNLLVIICAMCLSGTDGTVSCMASYFVCNIIFSSIIARAGNINVRTHFLLILLFYLSNKLLVSSWLVISDSLGVCYFDFKQKVLTLISQENHFFYFLFCFERWGKRPDSWSCV